MQPTSLAQAIKFAARQYPGESRDDLVRRINMVRAVMWKSPEKRELVFRTDGQEQVEQYVDFANWSCRRLFTGITLPVHVTVAEYLQIHERRVPIDGEVKKNLPAGYNGDHHRPNAARLAVKVALKRDIPVNNLGPVVFRCEDANDNGKRMGCEYIVAGGAIVREDILLSSSGPETTQVPVEFLKITFPQRCGFIRVFTDNGIELGSYHPSILSPGHIRIHINGACCGQLVHWIGLREPTDVVFDTDQVEMASEFDWINAFTWTDLHLKQTKTQEEMMTYQSVAAFDAASMASDLKAEQGAPGINLRPRDSRVMWRRLRGITNRRPGFHPRPW